MDNNNWIDAQLLLHCDWVDTDHSVCVKIRLPCRDYLHLLQREETDTTQWPHIYRVTEKAGHELLGVGRHLGLRPKVGMLGILGTAWEQQLFSPSFTSIFPQPYIYYLVIMGHLHVVRSSSPLHSDWRALAPLAHISVAHLSLGQIKNHSPKRSKNRNTPDSYLRDCFVPIKMGFWFFPFLFCFGFLVFLSSFKL